ncbi:MAG: integrin alpha [Planctomycetota bacterium]
MSTQTTRPLVGHGAYFATLLILSSICATSTWSRAQTTLLRFDPLPEGASRNRVPVAGLGDLDGDGFSEIGIGRASIADFRGQVRIHCGRSGALIASLDGDAGLRGSFGFSIARLDDLDRDGVDDFAIGAPVHPVGGVPVGMARVFSGRTRQTIADVFGDGEGDLFGSVIAAVGDVDRDGIDDFVVGAPENGAPIGHYGPGYAKLFSGRTRTMLRKIQGTNVADEFGSSLAPAGDVDGDGRADFLVGSLLESRPGATGQGSARIYAGSDGRVLRDFYAEAGSDHFGVAVAAVGDVDADGVGDHAIGAISMVNPLPGKVFVYSGADGQSLGVVVGPPGSGVFGLRIAAGRDVDQDGHDDFWVADPMDSGSGAPLGAVHLVSGRSLSIQRTLRGPNPGSGFGSTLETVEDLDFDGLPELTIGVPTVRSIRGAISARLDVVSSAPQLSTFGSGCSTTQVPRLDATSPRLGSSWLFFLSSRPVAVPGALMLSLKPNLPTMLPTGCVLYTDSGSSVPALGFVTDAAGRWFGSIALPAVAALEGLELATQGMVVATAGLQLYDLSNGVYATLRP